MSAVACFMRNNFYSNVPIRMNFARINNTLAHGDDGTPYAIYGYDMESKNGESWDWIDPARRIFSSGEIALGCNDLDGSTGRFRSVAFGEKLGVYWIETHSKLVNRAVLSSTI